MMPAVEPLCMLLGINSADLSREENFILEMALWLKFYRALKANYKTYYVEYFRIIKEGLPKRYLKMEINFIRCVINDIVATGEYTLAAIACYTAIPEEVIYEVMSGVNENPSWYVLRKIMALHQTVRADLYHAVIKNIITEYAEIPESASS